MAVLTDAKPIGFVLSCDVERLKPFYSAVLGLPLLGEDPFAATFDLGGGATLRLTAVQGHEPGPQQGIRRTWRRCRAPLSLAGRR